MEGFVLLIVLPSTSTRAFLNDDLLCNDKCFVTGVHALITVVFLGVRPGGTEENNTVIKYVFLIFLGLDVANDSNHSCRNLCTLINLIERYLKWKLRHFAVSSRKTLVDPIFFFLKHVNYSHYNPKVRYLHALKC